MLRHGDYLGELSTKAEFAVCLHNFRKLTAAVSFADACAHGLTLDDEALQEWAGFQRDPVSLLDQPVSALVVPVAHAHDALAAFPNGYFSCDLGPALNSAVARHLHEVHGYALMGVGGVVPRLAARRAARRRSGPRRGGGPVRALQRGRRRRCRAGGGFRAGHRGPHAPVAALHGIAKGMTKQAQRPPKRSVSSTKVVACSAAWAARASALSSAATCSAACTSSARLRSPTQ